jgi:hypothetical protein
MNDPDTTVVANVVDATADLMNAVFKRLSPEAQQNVTALIFHGAKVEVRIQLSPAPVVKGTIEAHGQETELFSVRLEGADTAALLN